MTNSAGRFAQPVISFLHWYTIVFLVLVSTSALHGQTNWLPGYYVSDGQDTVRGFVEYRLDRQNMKECHFRTSPEGPIVILQPTDVKGYTIDAKKRFESHTVTSRNGETIHAFFNVLKQAQISLLSYNGRYFAKDAAGHVHEISKQQAVKDSRLHVDYTGMGMLKTLLQNCAAVDEAALEKEYARNPDFNLIFENYYQCTGEKVWRTQEINYLIHTDIAFHAGLTTAILSLGGAFDAISFNRCYSYAIGTAASFFIPRINERLRVQLEATYNQASTYGFLHALGSDTNNDIFIDYKTLRMPLMLRYQTRVLLFEAGIQNQWILSQQRRWRVETISGSQVSTQEAEVPKIKPLTMGYTAGIGGRYKRWLIMARYSTTSANADELKPVFENIDVLLCYQLK